MIVVLSGEGPTDLGQCVNGQGVCQLPDFSHGPMTLIVDKAIEPLLNYSLLETSPEKYVYVSETRLKELERQRRNDKRRVSFVGKQREQETGFFYINAWMLGEFAVTREIDENDHVIAILFRDADGTRSTSREDWQRRWDSMKQGFQRAGLKERGVPMIPKPKSEAWMLCAVKENAYEQCAALERLPGNDSSPNSVKSKLEAALGGADSAAEQRQWIEEHGFDIDAVAEQMKSFGQFKMDLAAAITCLQALTNNKAL